MKLKQNLNTSHVKVNHDGKNRNKTIAANLNTSHVKVNLLLIQLLYLHVFDLNTSHVKVNPKRIIWYNIPFKFKYISC